MRQVSFYLIVVFLMSGLSTGEVNAFVTSTGELYGTVTDEDGNPLIGATVTIQGTLTGVLTDKNGYFFITDLDDGSITVKVSFIGYQTRIVDIEFSGSYELNMIMEYSYVSAGEVVVSATRAGARTPQTYSGIDNETIEKLHTGRDIPFLLGMMPSVVETSEAGNGIGYTNMRIRGTDANRINVTMDGIPLNDPESQQVFWVNLPDIASSVDNIQIQRGVGTSSNGSASFGATVSLDTKLPEMEPSVSIISSLGSFSTSKLTLAAGSGLIKEHFAMQVRVSGLTSDGYVYRTGSDHKAAMVTAIYRKNSSLLKANVIYGKEHTGIGWWGNPAEMVDIDPRYNPAGEYYDESGDRHFYDNESDNYEQTHFQLSWNLGINDNLSLSTAAFYTIGEGYYEEYKDDDELTDYGIPNQMIGTLVVDETDLIRQKWMSNDYVGLIYSMKYSEGVLDAAIGGTVNYFGGDHYGKIIWTEQPVLENNNDYQWYFNRGNKGEASFYGKGEIMLGDKLSVYGDLQYRYVTYEMIGDDDDHRELDQKHEYLFFNPKAGIYYSVGSLSDLYLSFSVGNREPTRSDYKEAADDEEAMPAPERLYDTEMGYSFRGKKVSTSINLYAMIYDDQLVPTGELSNTGYSIMTNVDDSYRLGAEVSLGLQPFEFFRWNIGTTLSSNKILNFKEYYSDYDTEDWSVSYKSKELGSVDIAYSPGVICTSDMNFIILPSLELHLVGKYVGKQYFDNTMNNDRSLSPYFVSNLGVGWNPSFKRTKNVTVQFVVNNLFNNSYISNGYGGNWYEDGTENTWAYYFPQAGINFMFRLGIEL